VSPFLLKPKVPSTDGVAVAARDHKMGQAGAWTAEQTVDFMIERIDAGDFYILCPDNDVPRRGVLFLAGALVLAVMWAVFALRILLGI